MRRVAVDGMKPEEPQNAQVIFADAQIRVTNKPDPPRKHVRQATQRINHRAACLRIDRVQGEIAPRRIFGHAGRIRHNRMAAIGCNITAQGCHLMRHAVNDDRHGAMLQARRHRAKPGGPGDIQHRFGVRICRQINITDRHIKNGVAHAAAHEQGLKTLRDQSLQKGLRPCRMKPVTGKFHLVTLSARPRRMRAVAPQI